MYQVLGSVRARLSVLAALSAVPLLVVAVALAVRPAFALSLGSEGRFVIVIIAFGTGIIIVAGAIEWLLLEPIRRLAGAVGHWRGGDGFDAKAASGLPSEIGGLALAFVQAARTLEAREAELRAAATRQELLMQEIHHRVKNNLQIVASLLNLQASRIRQPSAKAEFQAARDRVRALATLHRHLYTEGELRAINMRSFLMELCGQLFQAMGEREGDRIALTITAPEMQMSSDQAVPLSLIVTEAVSNAVKYAFPSGRHGHVVVQLTVEDTTVHLVVADDGVGIPAGQGESETGPRDGLGIHLIRGFARQLGAELEVREGEGTRYDVRIPLRHEREPEMAEETRAV